MKPSPPQIRIVQLSPNKWITMQDVIDNKDNKDFKIDTFKKQIKCWYFEPIKQLCSQPANMNLGMAILLLELTFFESHGQFIRGESSKKKSAKFFIEGMKEFFNYLTSQEKAEADVMKIFDDGIYDKLRCGLFHNGYLKEGVMINSLKGDKYSFNWQEQFECWFVNPWILATDIENYFGTYIDKLNNPLNESDKTLLNKFLKQFDDFFYSILKFNQNK